MRNSLAILTEIEAMLREKQVSFDAMTHLLWIEQRAAGKRFSMSEHIRGMIYALLSNYRSWEQIEDHIEQIDNIFFHYDADRILSTPADYFTQQLLQIKCGNISTRKQMNALHDNIRRLEKIEREFGSLDAFVTSGTPVEIADLLAKSLKYKLRTFGFALAMEYLRNVGIDTAKPDTHIRRILGKNRLGYTSSETAGELEAIEIISAMSEETGYSAARIDAILWLFCANGYGMICGESPHCAQCRLRERYCNHLE